MFSSASQYLVNTRKPYQWAIIILGQNLPLNWNYKISPNFHSPASASSSMESPFSNSVACYRNQNCMHETWKYQVVMLYRFSRLAFRMARLRYQPGSRAHTHRIYRRRGHTCKAIVAATKSYPSFHSIPNTSRLLLCVVPKSFLVDRMISAVPPVPTPRSTYEYIGCRKKKDIWHFN